MSSCGRCHAPIRWAFTERGKRMPLNFDPDPAGNIRLGPDGVAHYMKGPSLDPDDDGVRYMPHHATCPFADEYRRPWC